MRGQVACLVVFFILYKKDLTKGLNKDIQNRSQQQKQKDLTKTSKIAQLTNTKVKQAKPKDKLYKLSDGGGLLLRVKPNGFKTWIFDYYKPHTKARTSIGFGSYPEVSLANAST